MDTLRIATRKSPLALWQSEHVAARLRAAHPGLEVALVPLSTRGDEVLDRSLAAIGGKGLFLKELELAMERGEADCAVHSLKDVPMELEPGFVLPAVLERADPADAFVSNRFDGLDTLPHGARVGTSSLRRQAQLRARRPDLELRDLRGNVNTRLAKLDAGEYDAIVLACAGLLRLGLDARIRARLAPPEWLPAPAQAVVAAECRAGDARTIALLSVLEDAPTRIRIEAECLELSPSTPEELGVLRNWVGRINGTTYAQPYLVEGPPGHFRLYVGEAAERVRTAQGIQ